MVGLNTNKDKKQPTKKPNIKGFRLPASRKADVQDLINSLSSLTFLKISKDANDEQTAIVLNVESRDISKNPYLFSICYFRPDAVDVLYSEIENMSPRKRKLDVIKYVLNLLTLSSEVYAVELKYIYQMLEGSLSELNDFVSADYQTLYGKYDYLKAEHDDFEKKIKKLSASNKDLANENYTLKSQLQQLNAKLAKLEHYSDSVLAVKIQDWITEHNGEINISDFASVHGVSESRVEQVLNRLVSEGYLENRG